MISFNNTEGDLLVVLKADIVLFGVWCAVVAADCRVGFNVQGKLGAGEDSSEEPEGSCSCCERLGAGFSFGVGRNRDAILCRLCSEFMNAMTRC